MSYPARSLPFGRRSFMAAAALVGFGWIGPPILARASTDLPEEPADPPSDLAADEPVDPFVLLARAELARLGTAIAQHDLVGIADFSLPSNQPRFHLVDVEAGRVLHSFLVAHGRGSDPQHSGRVRRFSNEVGSNASSDGAYRTGERYVGKHGRSIRLDGLDASNSNAEVRAIVIHSAPYVSPAVLQAQGKLGRSEGCFVFSEDDHEVVLDRLGPDRLLLAGKF